MENLGEKLKNAYSLSNKGNNEDAKKEFEEICMFLEENELHEGSSLLGNYISSLLGLGSIFMNEGNMNKSLEYYEKGYKLTKGKDFNILFNLGVVHTNLGNGNEADKFLEEAKIIDPNNSNLIRFLKENGKSIGIENSENNNLDKSFASKIQDMIKKIK